ncbi:hypothetical protein [Roseobacter sp. EG26]|uniref:hypothetical protein n=1 Tax=Roseobacter sp. EG26 TaxID=3412477 RepID=UPI003CE453C9
MPQSIPPIRAHPGKPFRTLGDAAHDNQLVLMRCNMCRRGATFLASDLVQVVDPKHPVHLPPLPCSQCNSIEYVDIRVKASGYKDHGALVVRRLVGSKKVWLWENKVLGE